MKHKNKITKKDIPGLIMIALYLAVAGIALYHLFVNVQKDVYNIRPDKELVKNVELLERAEDGSGICLVTDRGTSAVDIPYLISDKYIAQTQLIIQPLVPTLKENTVFYDIEKEVIHTVTDEELEAVTPEYATRGRGRIWFQKQGKWYMIAGFLTDNVSEGERRIQGIVVDPDNGKIIEIVEQISGNGDGNKEDPDYSRELDIFWESNILDVNGFSLTDWYYKDWLQIWWSDNARVESGEVELKLYCFTLPDNNEALYSKFPGLRQYRAKKTRFGESPTKYNIQIHLKGRPSAEELMQLFMEDGEEISFEGVTTPAEYSVDGQEHKIDSSEDWNKWHISGASNAGTSVEDSLWD